MKPRDGRRKTGSSNHHPVRPHGADRDAELPQHARGALHVVAGEQTGQLARAARERRQHERAMRDALVARRAGGTGDVHGREVTRAERLVRAAPPCPARCWCDYGRTLNRSDVAATTTIAARPFTVPLATNKYPPVFDCDRSA